jgi:hypothetical protein
MIFSEKSQKNGERIGSYTMTLGLVMPLAERSFL